MVDWGFPQYPVPLLNELCQPAQVRPSSIRRHVALTLLAFRMATCNDRIDVVDRYDQAGEHLLSGSHWRRAPPYSSHVFSITT